MAKPSTSISSESGDASLSGRESVEYSAFIKFYSHLTSVFREKNYLTHFVTASIILPEDHHRISTLLDNDRAMDLLRHISAPLECGEKQCFYKMLEIMQTYGNLHGQQLAEKIKAFIRGVNPTTGTGTVIAVHTKGTAGPTNYVSGSITIDIDFSECNDISSAFSLLTAEATKLLKMADFFVLRRAILQQRKTPRGVQFPDDLYQKIKVAQDLDTLLDLLADSNYWSWVDLRLLETLIMSSGICEAKVIVKKYKEVIFSRKLSEVLNDLPVPQKKEHRDAYTAKVASKIEKEPNEVTVGDLSYYCNFLERVIMDINQSDCVLEHLDTGCLEIHWLIPTHYRFHAYKSALKNRHKFCDIHLQYLHIEPYPPIYDPFTIQPGMLSTLLDLSKPIASTAAEVISHFYCFLSNNLDNSEVCNIMLKLKLVTEGDLVHCGKMHSVYQQNRFLLDQLLVTDTTDIVGFSRMLQNVKNQQEFGHMLLSAINSIPAKLDDVETIMDRPSSGTPAYEPTSTIEDEKDVHFIYQSEVTFTSKFIHTKFSHLVSHLKQNLKSFDQKLLLSAFHKLVANTSHLQPIPLLTTSIIESLDDADIEEVFDRFTFLWSWNDHSILKAVLGACNCQDGMKMLDDFKLQIDTNQPIESFPIPTPSMKMAPSSSSSFTVLSIRVEYDEDDPVTLQYVNDVAAVMKEMFGISSHALLLLAARASPLMFYWMIPKSIVSLISTEVNKHSGYLKENRFLEIAIYPNTILFATDHLTNGSFALLSIGLQEEVKEEWNSGKPVKEVDNNEIERIKKTFSVLKEQKGNELSKLRAQLEEMKKKQGDEDRQLAELNVELETTRKTLNDKRSSIVKLNEELDSVRAHGDQMEGRIRELSDELLDKRNERMNKEKRLIELTIENKEYQDKVSSLEIEQNKELETAIEYKEKVQIHSSRRTPVRRKRYLRATASSTDIVDKKNRDKLMACYSTMESDHDESCDEAPVSFELLGYQVLSTKRSPAISPSITDSLQPFPSPYFGSSDFGRESTMSDHTQYLYRSHDHNGSRSHDHNGSRSHDHQRSVYSEESESHDQTHSHTRGSHDQHYRDGESHDHQHYHNGGSHDQHYHSGSHDQGKCEAYIGSDSYSCPNLSPLQLEDYSEKRHLQHSSNNGHSAIWADSYHNNCTSMSNIHLQSGTSHDHLGDHRSPARCSFNGVSNILPSLVEEPSSPSTNAPCSHIYKVVYLGNSGVGKSSVIRWLSTGSFKSETEATIGMDYITWTINVDNKPVLLQLWDTAGQERFGPITAVFCRHADAFILVYDITNRNSFVGIKGWIDIIKTTLRDESSILLLISNKRDVSHGDREVSTREGQKLAEQLGAIFMETSARSGNNVIKAHEELSRKLLEREDKIMNEAKMAPPPTLHIDDENSLNKKKCFC